MKQKISAKIDNIFIEWRRNSVSDIRLKDAMLKNHKEEVVDFALVYLGSYLAKKPNTFINFLTDVNYIELLSNKEYLAKMYDCLIDMTKVDNLNNDVNNCSVATSSGSCLDFGEFMHISLIDKNLDFMDEFVKYDPEDNVLDFSFFVNCRLDKVDLKKTKIELTTLTLLQFAYIDLINKQTV